MLLLPALRFVCAPRRTRVAPLSANIKLLQSDQCAETTGAAFFSAV